MFKFPRTPHLVGSRKQPGDEDLEGVPFAELAGRTLVVEEKVDGANAGISFSPGGELLLQSRGHYLTGGPREKHFALFKAWAGAHQDALRAALGTRHVLYGEWMFAKHTCFYDALPHLFLAFDALDTETGEFLDTDARLALVARAPVVSVPLLHRGPLKKLESLTGLLAHSRFKSVRWRERLREVALGERLDPERTARETDTSDLAEGLYVKAEENGRVVARYKFVRASFDNTILDSGSHWLSRPIVPNGLAEGVNLFGA
jgi:hypothetical protein